MSRILTAAVLLLIMTVVVAQAEIFRCTTSEGVVVFTDDPSRGEGDCSIERTSDMAVPNISPVMSQPEAPVMQQPGAPVMQQPGAPVMQQPEAPVMPQRGTPTIATPASQGVKSFAEFKSVAAMLTEQFGATRKQYFRASFVNDKLAAKRQMEEIREQKLELLVEIEKSSLTSKEKEEIKTQLSIIK
jgi:hypothetical protein